MDELKDAIEESVMENRIVTLRWSKELETALLAACEDHTVNGSILEAWGHGWRIHLKRSAQVRRGCQSKGFDDF